MISLEHPLIFALAPIVFLLWYVLLPERFGVEAPNRELLDYTRTPMSMNMLWMIRALAVLSLVALPVGVVWTHTSVESVIKKRETLVIVDISRSMLSEDITPSRMSVAKNTLKSFLLSRQEDLVSIIIFAGKPFLAVSRSGDLSGILTYIDTIHPGMILQDKPGLSGTNIGDAILLANYTLSGSQ